LAGCEPPRAPAKAPAAADIEIVAAEVRSRVQQAPAPPPPDAAIYTILPPTDRSCTLEATDWAGSLQLRPKGPVYGILTSASVSLSLGAETRDGSAVVEARGGLQLHGVVDAPALHLKAPTQLAGFVVPRPTASVSWEPTDAAGTVGISLDVSDLFEVPTLAQQVVPCEALTIALPAYNAFALIAQKVVKQTSVHGAVDLMALPGKPPLARMKKSGAHVVYVLAKQGAFTRVVIEMDRYYAFGWVPNESVHDLGLMLGLGGVGRGMAMGSSSSSSARKCRRDLDLIAAVAGERAIVGRLRIGTAFVTSTLDMDDGFTGVTFFKGWFRPAPAAKIMVRTADLKGC